MTSQESDPSTGRGDGSSGATGDTWPLCVPEEVEFSFSVGELIEFQEGETAATCLVDSIQASDSEQTVLLESCVDDDGGATGGFPLAVHYDQRLPLDDLVGQRVRVSYILEIGAKETYQRWYSLRDPEGRLLLAAYFTYADRVEPVILDKPQPKWLDPFSIARGEFVCPPEPGCEADDTPQRAVAEISDGVTTVEIVDRTVGEIGDYTLIAGEARAPDACEGRPTTAALAGLLYYSP